MKQMADKRRKEMILVVGELVLVKLQPYQQNFISQKPFSKLNQKFYGPYKILSRIGPMAYKVELPVGAQIHPVFHVSQLKRYHQDNRLHPKTLLMNFTSKQPVINPFQILKQRQILRDGAHIVEAFTQWEGLSPEDATWIPLTELKKSYPSFNLKDKVNFQEGGNDMNQSQQNLEG